MSIDNTIKEKILKYQKAEITEYYIYNKLAKIVKDPKNAKTLQAIADDELKHYHIWKKYSEQDVRPDKLKIWGYYLISRVLGFTFGVKLMESREVNAQSEYSLLVENIEEAQSIFEEEEQHENELLALLDEEMLRYTGSMVLGLNDALVELTGALAGFTLALRNTKLIALVGLVTGIAAALSMASSEYLSLKAEDTDKKPLRGSIYTGFAYLLTVVVLVLPFLVFENYYICLAMTLAGAILIIFMFNYYLSVAKDLPFAKHFLEMISLSLGVAAFSFVLGFVLRHFMGVDI